MPIINLIIGYFGGCISAVQTTALCILRPRARVGFDMAQPARFAWFCGSSGSREMCAFCLAPESARSGAAFVAAFRLRLRPELCADRGLAAHEHGDGQRRSLEREAMGMAGRSDRLWRSLEWEAMGVAGRSARVGARGAGRQPQGLDR